MAKTNRPLLFDNNCTCLTVQMHADLIVRGNGLVLGCADVKVHAVRVGVIVQDRGTSQLSGVQSGSHSPGLPPRCGQEEVRSSPT